jgi:hypothetical protein
MSDILLTQLNTFVDSLELSQYENGDISGSLTDIRTKVAQVKFHNEITIGNYYNPETNMFSVFTPSDEQLEVEEAKKTLTELLNKMKLVSMLKLKNLTEGKITNELTAFVSIMLVATKIVTGVMIIQDVVKLTCKRNQNASSTVADIENKTKELKDFLLNSTNLMFKMDVLV